MILHAEQQAAALPARILEQRAAELRRGCRCRKGDLGTGQALQPRFRVGRLVSAARAAVLRWSFHTQ